MRVAVYPGTFDPITLGHLSVIERGARLFDRLIVVIAVNPDKCPLFSLEERAEMIREATAHCLGVECASTTGLVVEFARERGARYLIRGIRGATDVEAEIALANANHELAPEIETVFVPAHPELSSVSSSQLKALAAQGLPISKYCSPEVRVRIEARFGAGALTSPGALDG
jgi:pantetheine-phosphate adenylyltransferase